MKTIVECIPNFSEGRRPEIIDQVLNSITRVPGVILLGSESDYNHNRSVVTFVGTPDAVVEAAVRSVECAAALIDLNIHQGEHPRLGATDVIPFVPIKGITMEECIVLARRAAERIATEQKIPIYLYERAATRPDRVNLADVRKGQFEGLRSEIGNNASRYPDFGEPKIHPTAGATVIGVRPALIAYNINLGTTDLSVAKKIAKALRGRDGGLTYVKALGFELKDRGLVQISMNMVNHEGTPLFRAFEMVRSEAKRYGVPIVGSEIVGLIPQAALNACSDFYLQIEGFSEDQILEVRLQQCLESVKDLDSDKETFPASTKLASSLGTFASLVSAGTPVPGGGSVSAYIGNLATALGQMMCNLTIGRAKYAEVESSIVEIRQQLEALSQTLEERIDQDAASFDSVLAARKLPKESEADKLARSNAIEEATQHAATVPFRMAHETFEVLELLAELAEIGNRNLLCDVAVGAQLALTAIRGAYYNVVINLSSLSNIEFIEEYRNKIVNLLDRAQGLASQIERQFLATV